MLSTGTRNPHLQLHRENSRTEAHYARRSDVHNGKPSRVYFLIIPFSLSRSYIFRCHIDRSGRGATLYILYQPVHNRIYIYIWFTRRYTSTCRAFRSSIPSLNSCSVYSPRNPCSVCPDRWAFDFEMFALFFLFDRLGLTSSLTFVCLFFFFQCFDYPSYMRLVITVPQDMLEEACLRIQDFCSRHHVKNYLRNSINSVEIQY